MQGFCERFLRFVAGEITDAGEWSECSCRDQGGPARAIPPVEGGVKTVEVDSRLEPFRPGTRITAS